MESLPDFETNDEPIELPPGFRFHPTDEELITHYLSPKVVDNSFNTIAIGEVALNKVEPWDLPWKAKMGEKEWYFFCTRDRKYPTGLRTNRATVAGYWKATGKDKEIFRGKFLVGMKKTLVFYRGRAPKGMKTHWVMHEYRMEGKHSLHHIPQNDKSEWVICRIFKKTSSGEKENHVSSDLPPLTDLSSDENYKSSAFQAEESSHVTCFAAPTVDLRDTSLSPLPLIFPHVSDSGSVFLTRPMICGGNLNERDSVIVQDQAALRVLVDCGEDRELSNIFNAHVDIDCLWNY